MVKRTNRTAAAVVIGNEILGGKIQESNVYELANLLRTLGVELMRVSVVPDELETIASELRTLSARHDYVFTSGGIGPTHDDVTIAAVAAAFGVGVTRDSEMEKLLRNHYGDDVTENHLLLANVPEGSERVYGGRSPWPATVYQNVWMLPGIPEVFRMKLRIVEERLKGGVPFVSRAVFTKLDEARLKTLLDETVARYPDVEVGSYPRWNDPKYETKVTFDGQNEAAVDSAFEHFTKGLPDGEPQWTE